MDPLPDGALVIEPAVPDSGRVPVAHVDLSLSQDVWVDEGDDPNGLTSPAGFTPDAVLAMADDLWLRVDAAPPDLPEQVGLARTAPVATGSARGGGDRPSTGGRPRRRASSRRPVVLVAIAALGAVALLFGLRSSGLWDGSRVGADAAGRPAATTTLPTSPPPTFLPPTPTTAPAATSSSLLTSTTSSTAPPSTTTSTPATTRVSTTATSTPPTTARAATPATLTTIGSYCGFVPGSTVEIERNGVPQGHQVAGPDGCVSGLIIR